MREYGHQRWKPFQEGPAPRKLTFICWVRTSRHRYPGRSANSDGNTEHVPTDKRLSGVMAHDYIMPPVQRSRGCCTIKDDFKATDPETVSGLFPTTVKSKVYDTPPHKTQGVMATTRRVICPFRSAKMPKNGATHPGGISHKMLIVTQPGGTDPPGQICGHLTTVTIQPVQW